MGEPASGWETMGKDGVFVEVLVSAGDLLRHINPAWSSRSHQDCKAGALRPCTGRQMVLFGKGPQPSDLFAGFLWSRQEQTQSPSVGNVQEPKSVNPPQTL